MATVQARQIVEYVLANPKMYPGLHMSSQQRTSQGMPQLDPQRQMLLIWNAMCSYVQEVLDSGKSMNIRTFGSFTFEPILYAGGHAKNPRGDKLHFRPCFLVAPELRKHLYRYPGKEEMTMQEGSIYQQGCQMSFLNYVPIAAGTYLKEPVIRSSLQAFFSAVVDLLEGTGDSLLASGLLLGGRGPLDAGLQLGPGLQVRQGTRDGPEPGSLFFERLHPPGAERRLAVAEERIETAALRDVAEQEPQQSDDGVPSSSRVGRENASEDADAPAWDPLSRPQLVYDAAVESDDGTVGGGNLP